MNNMLPKSHVLDLIHGLSSASPKVKVNPKKQFVDNHQGKWAVIRQEHINNGQGSINHIESVHNDISEIPFHSLSKHHIVQPVSDEMVNHGSFRGHEKFI